jgi:glycosyltransferase involved in cell wall biosynthesis
MTKTPKVAIVHDWLTVSGGAEKVCRELINIYPDADVFSLVDFLSDAHRKEILNGKKSTTSVIQRFPFSKSKYRYYLPLFPYAIEQLQLEQYDLVISSSYAVAKGVITRADQLHVCYCHSPMRYLWDLYFNYVPKVKWTNFPYAILMRFFISRLRIWDVVSSNRVDHFVANSKNVAARIQKIYRRTAAVVYPPLDTEQFNLTTEKKSHYITASRLVPYKRVDLMIEVFKELPNQQLLVLGDGPERKRLKQLAGNAKNVEILGYVSRAKHQELVGQARAFINASFEDFGIAPLEAQACGTPVVAFARGGILETTIEGQTAVYFHQQTAASLKAAIERFEQTQLLSPEAIRQFALQFNNQRFRTEMAAMIKTCQEQQP